MSRCIFMTAKKTAQHSMNAWSKRLLAYWTSRCLCAKLFSLGRSQRLALRLPPDFVYRIDFTDSVFMFLPQFTLSFCRLFVGLLLLAVITGAQEQLAPTLQFVNVARSAGITAKTIYGGEKSNKFQLENVGTGIAFLTTITTAGSTFSKSMARVWKASRPIRRPIISIAIITMATFTRISH